MKTLVVAAHADDEVLGCGGLLQKADEAFILYLSKRTDDDVKMAEQVCKMTASNMRWCNFDYLVLPTLLNEAVEVIKESVDRWKPEQVLLPFWGDMYQDHRTVFEAGSSVLRSYRSSIVKKVMVYETLPFEQVGVTNTFVPNMFCPMSIDEMSIKLKLCGAYSTEAHPFLRPYNTEAHPFLRPRSLNAIRSLAMARGVRANVAYAEAFMILREILT